MCPNEPNPEMNGDLARTNFACTRCHGQLETERVYGRCSVHHPQSRRNLEIAYLTIEFDYIGICRWLRGCNLFENGQKALYVESMLPFVIYK